MDRKRWIIGLLGVALIGGLWWGAEAQVSGNRIHNLVVGRFSLLAGANVVHYHNGDTEHEPSVYKFDSTTGRAWKLHETIDDQGRRTLSWNQVPHMNVPDGE